MTAALGARFAEARKRRGWSLRDAERASGVPNAHISQIETGAIQEPGIGVVAKLAQAYGLHPRLVSSWCALRLCRSSGCEEPGCQCECHGGHARHICGCQCPEAMGDICNGECHEPAGIIPAGDRELSNAELADFAGRWEAARQGPVTVPGAAAPEWDGQGCDQS